MKNRRTLVALSGAAISALLLSGCAIELISADNQCAEVVADPSPDLTVENYDFNGGGITGSSDVSFDFSTSGYYENLYAHFAWPEVPFDFVLQELEGDWNDADVYGVERYASSYDIIEGDPHRVNIDFDDVAVVAGGAGNPVAIIVACDEVAYNSTTPTASPEPSTSYAPVALADARITQLTPGYSDDHAVVSVTDGLVEADFPSSRNTYFASTTVVPWMEGYGDIEDMTYEQGWWTLATSFVISMGNAPYVDDADVNGGDATFDYSESFDVVVSEWESYFSKSELGSVSGAVIILYSVEQIDSDTAQIRYSFHPATLNEDGLLGASGEQTIDYVGPQYNDDQLKGRPGEQVTIVGSNMLVNSARIGGQNARIVSNTSTQLTIEIPAGLAGGRHNVELGFDGGSVTRQLGATVIDHSVWTKRIAPTQAKVYAKNVVGVGKVRFVVNGSEIAWVNAVDANDPKLRKVGAANYLVRTVNLKAGKNVLEIYVDGTREQRTVYTR